MCPTTTTNRWTNRGAFQLLAAASGASSDFGAVKKPPVQVVCVLVLVRVLSPDREKAAASSAKDKLIAN